MHYQDIVAWEMLPRREGHSEFMNVECKIFLLVVSPMQQYSGHFTCHLVLPTLCEPKVRHFSNVFPNVFKHRTRQEMWQNIVSQSCNLAVYNLSTIITPHSTLFSLFVIEVEFFLLLFWFIFTKPLCQIRLHNVSREMLGNVEAINFSYSGWVDGFFELSGTNRTAAAKAHATEVRPKHTLTLIGYTVLCIFVCGRQRR